MLPITGLEAPPLSSDLVKVTADKVEEEQAISLKQHAELPEYKEVTVFNLPAEILIYIISFLPPCSWRALALTCRTGNILVNNVFKFLFASLIKRLRASREAEQLTEIDNFFADFNQSDFLWSNLSGIQQAYLLEPETLMCLRDKINLRSLSEIPDWLIEIKGVLTAVGLAQNLDLSHMVDSGCFPTHIVNEQGRTAIQIAIFFQNYGAIEILSRGASNKELNDWLRYAIQCNKPKSVHTLVKKLRPNLNLEAEDKDGLTLVDYASDKDPKIAEILCTGDISDIARAQCRIA